VADCQQKNVSMQDVSMWMSMGRLAPDDFSRSQREYAEVAGKDQYLRPLKSATPRDAARRRKTSPTWRGYAEPLNGRRQVLRAIALRSGAKAPCDNEGSTIQVKNAVNRIGH
jgi:hypothetical protein